MSVSFTLGATTKMVRNPAFPESSPKRPRQTIGRSAGGTPWVYTRGTPAFQMRLNFKRLTNTEKTDLESFIENTANFGANAFTYTDQDSTQHLNMRIVDTGDWFTREQQTLRWTIAITLEQDES